jgi:transposase-like protein
MKRYGNPLELVTDRLRSYRAAMKEIGNEARQATGRWLYNRAENPHNRSGAKSEQWLNSKVPSRYRNSLQHTRHSTITSIKDAIYIAAKRSNSTVSLYWCSGVNSPPKTHQSWALRINPL